MLAGKMTQDALTEADINTPLGFDSFPQAYLTIFTVMTSEQWIDALYLGIYRCVVPLVSESRFGQRRATDTGARAWEAHLCGM